jgi:hypothetical protein
MTFKISEVDEPGAGEYASASQFFQPLAGEEILTANQRDGGLEDLAGLRSRFPKLLLPDSAVRGYRDLPETRADCLLRARL